MSEDVRDPKEPESTDDIPRARGRRLRIVSFATEAPKGEGAPPLRLVREYKGPTVDAVLRAPPPAVARLPGRICTVLEAIDDGDLAAADRRLTAALGALPGPGSQRRRPLPRWRWLLVLWAIAALATTVALT